jgi:phosphoesterase RecJ-like protein
MDAASKSWVLPVMEERHAPKGAAGFAVGPEAAATERMQAILDVLRQGKRFLVCSHSRPDGDAVGSMLVMTMLLEAMGKQVDVVTADRVPDVYRNLPRVGEIQTVLGVEGEYDAAILLECDGVERTRLRGLEAYFLINIDHHASGCSFGALNWIDRNAASVGELVYRMVKAAGVRLTPEMASCLYITLLTDTGGFCYGTTKASTFEQAAELVRAGANPVELARNVYFSMATSKLLLLGAALNNLHREGRLAWLWVHHADVMRTRAAEEDCEGIVNFALAIAGVEAAVFLRELADGSVRVSMRSKGRVDVAAIAASLGGGGHEAAAGCTLDGPLSAALAVLLARLRPAVALEPIRK